MFSMTGSLKSSFSKLKLGSFILDDGVTGESNDDVIVGDD